VGHGSNLPASYAVIAGKNQLEKISFAGRGTKLKLRSKRFSTGELIDDIIFLRGCFMIRGKNTLSGCGGCHRGAQESAAG
jgi:hypothetical protein